MVSLIVFVSLADKPEKKSEEAPKPAKDTSGAAPSKTPSVPEPPKSPQREKATSQISVTPAKQQAPPSGSAYGGTDPNKISGTRSETRVKMSRMRLKIAERLKEAQNSCAMLTTFNEIDMRYPTVFEHPSMRSTSLSCF